MRAVLDANVIVSALISASGPPAEILRAWQRGEFELLCSPKLIEELKEVLGYPKIRARLSDSSAAAGIDLIASAERVVDPDGIPPVRSVDPDDDYLLALAASERAALVSGDKHLRDLKGTIPVYSPREFLDLLEA